MIGNNKMSKLRVAIIGAGAISSFHLTGWKAENRAELVAICDLDSARAQAQAAAFGVPAVFTEAAEMLAAIQPDALDIVTPVGTHADLVRLAAEHRVDVMCQKPMCATVAEAETLVADIAERVRFMVHENYRFRPHYAELATRVRQGEIGRLRHARLVVRSSSVHDYPGKVPWLLARQPYLATFGRLLVFEFLIHQLDALRAIVGEMRVTAARLSRLNPELKGEDTALIALECVSGPHAGALIEIDACISALGYPGLPRDRLELIGDADTIRFDVDHITRLSMPQVSTHHDLDVNYQACFNGAIAAFVTGLVDGTAFPTDRLDNLETLKLMEAVYRIAENDFRMDKNEQGVPV